MSRLSAEDAGVPGEWGRDHSRATHGQTSGSASKRAGAGSVTDMARAVTRSAPTLERSAVVQAAGGVLLRRSGRRRLEVAAVHRPVRRDWSLPKGKLDQGETFEQCALREVLEETGYACILGAFAGQTQYVDRRGRPKVVAYWYMDPAPGVRFEDPAPLLSVDEVDEVRWLELTVATRALTYPHDRELLGRVGEVELARLG